MSYIGAAPGLVARQKFRFVATAGQTAFSGTDLNGLTLNFEAGKENVYLNGRIMPPDASNYNTSGGSVITFTTALNAGDEVYIEAIGAYNIATTTGSGGGMFKGDNGTVGDRSGDIFRITEQQLDTNTTIGATENASAPGPLAIASGVTLTINDGGNLVIL